jgi:hypothetical protein
MTIRSPDYPATPNLDKALKIQETSQAIGEFLDWLGVEKHYSIMETRSFTETRESYKSDGTHVPYDITISENLPIRDSKERLLAEFFGIDYDAMNKEQELVLNYVRNHNG